MDKNFQKEYENFSPLLKRLRNRTIVETATILPSTSSTSFNESNSRLVYDYDDINSDNSSISRSLNPLTYTNSNLSETEEISQVESFTDLVCEQLNDIAITSNESEIFSIFETQRGLKIRLLP